ncbi:MAG: peroxiredoxin [Geminicoccaceae bacterium]
MPLRIGDTAPDFMANTTNGPIKFHNWIGSNWAILFSHPKNFTPVCTTELGYMAGLKSAFDQRNVKVIGLSVDPISSHDEWATDIEDVTGHALNYPLIGDNDLRISKLYDMLSGDAGDSAEGRTAVANATVRNVFVIGPDKKVKLMIAYPMSTGRNFDEILRVIDSLQLTAEHQVATPVNWQRGDDVIIVPTVSDDDAKARFPEGWRAPKPYIRFVPQPGR